MQTIRYRPRTDQKYPARYRAGQAALLLGLCLTAQMVQAARPAGMGFSFSRVVLMEEKRGGASVAVVNNTDNVYLMQSRIQAADIPSGMPVDTAKGAPPPPFVVLPPLQRIEAHGELPLRIMVTPDNRLPTDRESVFFLTTKAIPSVSPMKAAADDKGGRVVLALANSIKLFYRPTGLKDNALGEASKQLTVQQADNAVRITNPSPYYITFASLSVNGKALNADVLRRMVPPRSSQTYPLPAGITGGDVRWRVIDEYGLNTDEQHAALR